MGLSTYFNAEIRHSGIKEMIDCLEVLHGLRFMLQDSEGKLHDPHNIYFCDNPEHISSYMKNWDNLPYGSYSLMDPLAIGGRFAINIDKDTASDDIHSAGDKITIHDFIDAPYDEEKDFKLLKDLCYHMGGSSFSIHDEYTGKVENKSFEDLYPSIPYFREIRGNHIQPVVKGVSAALLDSINDGKISVEGSLEKRDVCEEVDKVYDYLMEKRKEDTTNNPFMDNDYMFLKERVVVKGFILSEMSKEDYAATIKEKTPALNYNLYERVLSILNDYEESRDCYEKTLEEDKDI